MKIIGQIPSAHRGDDGASPIPSPGEQSNMRRNLGSISPAGVSRIIRWIFYAFVFSLSFETVNIGVPLELPTIIGAFLVIVTPLQPRIFLRQPPAAFWLFSAYLCYCAALAVFVDDPRKSEVAHYLFVSLQLLLLCWIGYNLMRYPEVAKKALLVLIISCVLLVTLQLSGMAHNADKIGKKPQRFTALDFHPNNIARIFSLGVIGLVGLIYAQKRSTMLPRLLSWLVVFLLGVGIVQTGSRGGLLAVGTGLMVFALAGRTLRARIRNALVVVVALGVLAWVTYESEATKVRFERALTEGELARRENIYPTAWKMFLEKPLFGWGPITSSYELGGRLRHPYERTKNSHNLVLEVMVVTGIIGAIIFFSSTGLAVLASWKGRRGAHGILPFAMMATVLAANMSGLWHFNKLHWLVMAYALASSSRAAVVTVRRAAIKPLTSVAQLRLP